MYAHRYADAASSLMMARAHGRQLWQDANTGEWQEDFPALDPEAEAAGLIGQAHRMLAAGGGNQASSNLYNSNLVPWHQAVLTVFWAVFGEFDRKYFDLKIPFGQPVLFVYILVSSIILVNLLVAMFSDT